MKKTRFILIIALALGLGWSAASCDNSNPDSSSEEEQVKEEVKASYQIAFYNVENLFDTLDNPTTKDEEFTPDSEKAWNTEKYQTKLEHLAQVLASIDSVGQLAAIGLAEVENRQVLEDLIQTGFFQERSFGIVHQESPDFRGIDVAFIYDKDLFTVSDQNWLTVDLNDSDRTTRDILHVRGNLGQDELHLYVNHWPSRWGGTAETEPKRKLAASTLRSDLDQVMKQDPGAKVLIMGDLNDYPSNASVLEVLGADSLSSGSLVNGVWQIHKDPELGTHAYRGEWGVLDHIILSQNLLAQVDTIYAHKRNYMCYENKEGKMLPSRSFSRDKYYGGYSDHLPVVLKMNTISNE